MLRPEEAQRPYTVTELANEIRRELRPLTALLVKGEVSGMKRGTGGHYNFTIRDGVSKLEAVGAFAASRKRRLPFLPQSVAILTSPTGAVIHDLQETIWERYPNMGVVVYPVQVQGAAAPMSVSRAMRRCNQEALAQVIVLARGGGSFEELYSFNTELVARAILDSRLPVVTALGHSSDRTVADMVADVEARTPTEAGSRVVPKKADLVAMLRERERRLDRETNQRVLRETERLQVKRSRLLQVLPAMLRVRTDRLALAAANLVRLSPVQQVARREEALRERARRLSAAGAARLTRARNALASRRAPDRLERALSERFAAATRGLEHRRERLLALSPDAVLSRGYSITQDAESGVVIRSATETSVDRRIRVRLATGRVGARVEQVEP